MKSNFLFLIVGKSGSGKTTVVYKLQEKYGLKVLESYTTRAPRYEGETGHTFLDPSTYTDYEDLKQQYPNRIAETVFNGNFYFATEEQANDCDLYIIDPWGIENYKHMYHRPKQAFIIYIDLPDNILAERMAERGDSPEKIIDRLDHDQKAFEKAEELSNVIIRLSNSDAAVDTIHYIMKERLRMDV